MMTVLVWSVLAFNVFVGAYFVLLNSFYAFLLALSLFSILMHIRRIKYAPFKDFYASPATPPVSIIIPVYNEENIAARSVRSALAANYPSVETIVVNDGSDDGTLGVIIREFGLVKIDRVYRRFLKTGPVKGFYHNKDIPNLLVIDKERGGKSNALNCGINASRCPYFCSVDADSLLEPDALIRIMTPVIESSVPVVACGGVVRVLNGVSVEDGARIGKIELSKNPLVLFQIVEYLRGFLFGRVGWDALNSTLILSGTFSLFHKSSVIEAGGFRKGNVSEDMEMIVRLHRVKRAQGKPYAIRFISDPVCWTEVPETFTMLARQRRRWHLGLIQSISQNREMLLDPKYGRIGMVVMPYYLAFEIIGPVIEVTGYIVVFLSYALGLLDVRFLMLFLTVAVFYGIFLSTAGVFLEELTYRRYPRWGHMLRLLLYGVIENFGYRQINSFWRLQATVKYLCGRRGWEHVQFKGARENGKNDG